MGTEVMSGYRLPGVICRTLHALEIDPGTLCQDRSPVPGPLTQKTAPPNEEDAPAEFVDASFESITDSVGNGFCVPLVQLTTTVGHTSTWRTGRKLNAKPDVKRGTVIATFNAEDRYESKDRGNHAAFFVEYATQDGHDGIVIYDQYREWPDKERKTLQDLGTREQKLRMGTPSDASSKTADQLKNEIAAGQKALEKAYPEIDDQGRRFRRKQPGRRFIAFDRKGNVSNNASAYSVVTH